VTYGPRVSGGYQFPRTNAARLTRGRPVAREEVPGVGTAEVVPLEGGFRRQWDVCGVWTDREGNGQGSTYIATDELEARAEFQRLLGEMRREVVP
jgi:hypothetical protein